MFLRALASISGVMSTPITRPAGPSTGEARKASKPAPQPRSNTVWPGLSEAIASGLPQPSPRLAPAGTAVVSAAEYPSAWETLAESCMPDAAWSPEQQVGAQPQPDSRVATLP